MPDLLLELLSEEIPARMQTQAAKDLERLVVGALSDRGLMFEGSKAFAGSRRLTLTIHGLPAKQPDVSEEKKGPRVNAPEKAIEGFLRSAGLTLEQCEKRDDGKGEFYVAVIARKGRATEEVLAEYLPSVLAEMRWPKSMRWPQNVYPDILIVRQTGDVMKLDDGRPITLQMGGRWVGHFDQSFASSTAKSCRSNSPAAIAAARRAAIASCLKAKSKCVASTTM